MYTEALFLTLRYLPLKYAYRLLTIFPLLRKKVYYFCPEKYRPQGGINGNNKILWGKAIILVKILTDNKISCPEIFWKRINRNIDCAVYEYLLYNSLNLHQQKLIINVIQIKINFLTVVDKIIFSNNFSFDIKNKKHCIKLHNGSIIPELDTKKKLLTVSKSYDYLTKRPIFIIVKPKIPINFSINKSKVHSYIYLDVESPTGISVVFYNRKLNENPCYITTSY